MMRMLAALGLCVALGLCAAFISPVLAAQDPEPWERWMAHDPTSDRQVDHRSFTAFLQRYRLVSPEGVALLDYGAVTVEDRAALDGYIHRLERTEVATLTRDAQFAFWVNAYNALTIRVILDHYPVDSIRDIDISPGLFSDGPWGAQVAVIDGTPVTLDDIEHRILRGIWRDPRVHFVVNCASIGCPDLPAEPLEPDTLEATLDAAARAYLAHPRGLQVTDRGLVLSSIFNWFEEDFGETQDQLLGFVARYAPDGAAIEGQRIRDYDYDWDLNDAQ